MRIILALIAIMISLQAAYAWTNYTTIYVAQQVLHDEYPRCGDYIDEGVLEVIESEEVDPALGEPVNMHCDTLTCPAYDPNYCQTGPKSCASEYTAGQVKNEAKDLCNCLQAKKLASAVTYFIAKYNPMNLMINENCSEGFNQAVEDALKSGNATWTVSYQCDAPNRVFTFSSTKMEEMIFGASSFAFAEAHSGTSAWYCYNMGGTGDNGNGTVDDENKLDGALCANDAECLSGNCDNNVCCSGERCCPVPGLKGYPCGDGEQCSPEYSCTPISYGNGFRCESDGECNSGYCGPSTKTSLKKYCCNTGNDNCCGTDDDCITGEKCEYNTCVTLPPDDNGNGNGDSNGGDDEIEEKLLWCLPFALLSVLAAAGYFLTSRY